MNAEWYKDNEAEYMLFCSSLSTDENDLVNISIYPNPSKDNIYVNLQLEVKYKLMNVHGQEINNGVFLKGVNDLDVSSGNCALASALYKPARVSFSNAFSQSRRTNNSLLTVLLRPR